MKKTVKKILLIIIILLLITMSINLIGAPIMFNIMFDRYDKPDYNVLPGVVNYQEVKNKYPRTDISFKSHDNTLQGYYYEVEDSEAIVVMSHGIHDGADSLLNVAITFIDNGFSVFSFDNSGCSDSTGKVLGFTQSLIDLEAALKYIESNNELHNKKILLFGYSWGGYATTAILNLEFDIAGAVSIAGYNDSEELIVSKGKSYVGPLVYTGSEIVKAVQRSRFGKYVDYTAVNGINKTNTPVFIAHGEDDSVIRYKEDSIIINKSLITNPNVKYYLDYDDNHTTILYSDEAIEYQNIVDNKLDSLSNYNDKKEYVETINDSLYSELDVSLFDSIISFYNKCI